MTEDEQPSLSSSPEDDEVASLAKFSQHLLDEKWVEDTVSEDEDMGWMVLGGAGMQWVKQFYLSKLPRDQDRAIRYLERSVEAGIPDEDFSLQINLQLGMLFYGRFKKSMELHDIDKAITALEWAVALAPPPTAGQSLCELGNAFLQKFEAFRNPDDLNHAVENYQKALSCLTDSAPGDSRLRIICLANLCNAASMRGSAKEAPADFKLAMESGQRALDMMGKDDPLRAVVLVNLSAAYHRTPDLTNMDKAIEVGREAMRLPMDDPSIYVRQASNLGWALMIRYGANPWSNVADLDDAISLFEQGLERSGPEDIEWSSLLHKLGEACHERFERQLRRKTLEADYTDLDRALQVLTLAIDTSKPSTVSATDYDVKLSHAHFTIGSLWQQRFALTEELGDLDNAICSYREAAAFDVLETGEVLFCLSTAFALKFFKRQNLEDLDYAIESLLRSMHLLGDGSQHYISCASNLCGIVLLRYRIRLSLEDLDLVIRTGEEADSLPLVNDHHRGVILTNLCGAYLERFRRKGETKPDKSGKGKASLSSTRDLDRAIEIGQRAVQLISYEGFFKSFSVATLNEAYNIQELVTKSAARAEKQPSPTDEQPAPVEGTSGQKTNSRWSEFDYLNGEGWAELLGGAKFTSVGGSPQRLEQDGLPSFLAGSQERIVFDDLAKPHAGSRPGPDQPRPMLEINNSICSAWAWLVQFKNDPNYSIMVQLSLQRPYVGRFSEILSPLRGGKFMPFVLRYRPLASSFLYSLGTLHRAKFNASNNTKELDAATFFFANALTSDAPGFENPNQPIILRNWGEALHTRFERKLNSTRRDEPFRPVDLTEIDEKYAKIGEKLTEGMKGFPLKWEALVRADNLEELTEIAIARFLFKLTKLIDEDRHGDFEFDDVEEAVQKLDEALKKLSVHSDMYVRADYPNALADAFLAQFKKKSSDQGSHDGNDIISLEDINEGITKLEEAFKKLPANREPYVRADYLKTLADALITRFEVSRFPTHAPAWMAETEWDIKVRSFGGYIMSAPKFKLDKELARADVGRAIKVLEKAVGIVKGDARLHALYSWHLAKAFGLRYEFVGSHDDRQAAIRNFEVAAKATAAPLSCRIPAANSAVQLLIESDDLAGAAALARVSVELLQLVHSRGNPKDRKKMLSMFKGTTAQAVSLSIARGEDPYESLRLSEIGRGILAGAQIDKRYASRLEDMKPMLAKELGDLQACFEVPGDEPVKGSFGGSILRNMRPHDSTLKRYNQLLAEIRQIPGMEFFLDTVPKEALAQIIEDGRIVVLNVSEMRSDAILVSREGTSTCHLGRLDPLDLQRKAQKLIQATSCISEQDYPKHLNTVNTILEWLWDTITEPILKQLGCTETPGDGEAWPRVWWVATGILSVLPLHAAGYHNESPPRTVMDRVISTYLPTVKALAYARTFCRRTVELRRLEAMLLSMPTTPDQDDLPRAEEETDVVGSLMQPSADVHAITPTRKSRVLGALEEHEIAHIVCHGEVSVEDPSQSRLLLSDWQEDPLTAEDIAELNTTRPQFAYLAACHTSSVRELKLMDESIHLSSSFLLAGFPSVIGSLWSISDERSVDIARLVYERMFDNSNKFDPRAAAAALHHAVRSVKQEIFEEYDSHDPIVWAPFLHIGV